jgi:hypothetical protein
MPIWPQKTPASRLFLLCSYLVICPKAYMHNIRRAGQMWPAEAFNVARKTPNFVYFASFFDDHPLNVLKRINFGPWKWQKKKNCLT